MPDEGKFPSLGRSGLDRRDTTWGLLGVAVLLALTFIGSSSKGLTVLGWATATFWFPLMVTIGIWRRAANP